MLDFQNLNIATAEGLDTKSDPKQEPKGFFVTLINTVFRTIGELRKRYGYDAISTNIIGGSTISSGTQIAAFGSELVESDAASAYSYSSTATAWSNRGVMPIVNLSTAPIARSGNYMFNQDSAYNAGYYAYVWNSTPVSATNLYYSIIDATTGTAVVSQGTIDTNIAGSYKIVALGTNFVVVYKKSGDAHIYYKAIAVATPTTLGSRVTIDSDLNATYPAIDVYINSAVAPRAYISYINAANGTSFYYLSTALALSSKYSVASTNQQTLGIFGDASGNTWAGGADGTNTFAIIVNAALNSTVLAKTTIEAAVLATNFIGTVSGTTATIYYEIAGVSNYLDYIRQNTCTTAGVVGTAAYFVAQNGIAAKAFTYGTHTYILTIHDSSLQPTYFLLRDDGYCVARIAQSSGGYVAVSSAMAINTISAGVFQFAYLQSDLDGIVGGVIYPLKGVSTATITFLSPTSVAQSLGQGLHFTGGMLQLYDGAAPAEHGFHLSPENVAVSTGTSGSMTAGVYSAKFTYEWVDAQGQIHRSAPSTGTSFTIGAISNGSASFTVPMLPITSKSGKVAILAYQTLPNGTTYYCTSATVYSGKTNDPTTNTATIVLTAPDNSGNLLLYTNGGEVDNDPAQSCNIITTFKSRMMANVIGNPLQYQYSKQVITGSPVEFSADFVGNIDSKIGSFTAGATLDGNFIFFGPDSVFYMVGDGPTPSGTNNDFSTPQLISSDCGCSNQSSIVVFPNGLMFQTPAKGIYLLDRSLQVSYIGAAVSQFNTVAVTSAVLVKNQNQVRFTLANGTVLAYDYLVNQWAQQSGISAVGACLWQSAYSYLKSTGAVYQEDTTIFNDAGTEVDISLKTGWYSFAGVQGYQRARRLLILGEYKSAHTLTVNIYYNFSSTIGQTVTIPVAADPAPYQFRIPLLIQKCEAIQVEIIESGNSGGEGFSLSNLAVEVGVKKGLNKLPAAATYGS